MNFNTLSTCAKLCKKLQTYATGQTVTSGEVPNIAIINSTEIIDSKKLVDNVTAGIRNRGGISAVFNTPSLGFLNKINTMTAKYAESFRLNSAACAEAIIRTNMADGAVIVSDCDVTAAGLLLGCLRTNCPVLILPTGTNANFNTDILKITGKLAAGKINAKSAEDIIGDAALPKGISDGFTSTSTFFMAAEAMGLSVANASLNRYGGGAQLRAALATGEQIVVNSKNILTPKKFITKASFANAAAVCLAAGGDICALDSVIKLAAINDSKIAHGFIAELSAKTPLLAAPGNQNCTHLRGIGGVYQILKILSAVPKLIDGDTLTADGGRLKAVLAAAEQQDIQPVSKTARIVVAKGTACEEGGYVQPADNASSTFSGKAWVYQSLEDADKAVTGGSLPAGSIIVVHNCVNTNIAALAYAIEGMDRSSDFALVTDGICEKTDVVTITNCRPSSLDNEEFANIQTGDALDIDLTRGRFNTSITAKDLKSRAKRNTTKKQVLFF